MTSTKTLEMLQNGVLPIIHENREVVAEIKSCWCLSGLVLLEGASLPLRNSKRKVIILKCSLQGRWPEEPTWSTEAAKLIRICWLALMYLRVLFNCRNSVC